MPEEIIYRGDTEDERIESAVTYTSLMNLVERFRAGQVYCTSQELAAFIKCLDVAIPYWIEIPQPPQMPEGVPMAPVAMAPVPAPAGAPVAPVPSGQQNPPRPCRLKRTPPDPAGALRSLVTPMRKANIFSGSVMLAGIGVMIAMYLVAFTQPNHGVLLLVDEYHEGIAELVMFIAVFLIGAWNLLQDVKLCIYKNI